MNKEQSFSHLDRSGTVGVPEVKASSLAFSTTLTETVLAALAAVFPSLGIHLLLQKEESCGYAPCLRCANIHAMLALPCSTCECAHVCTNPNRGVPAGFSKDAMPQAWAQHDPQQVPSAEFFLQSLLGALKKTPEMLGAQLGDFGMASWMGVLFCVDLSWSLGAVKIT